MAAAAYSCFSGPQPPNAQAKKNILENPEAYQEHEEPKEYREKLKVLNLLAAKIKNENVLSDRVVRLKEKLSELYQVLGNKNCPNNEIRRNALLGTCARLMEEVDTIQGETNFLVYAEHPNFPKKTRNQIWHGTFFDEYDDRQIESIAARIYNDCSSAIKLNKDKFEVGQEDNIYNAFWYPRDGVGYKIGILKRNIRGNESNEECIKEIDYYINKFHAFRNLISAQGNCVVYHGIKFVEAKIGVCMRLIFSHERKHAFQKLCGPKYIKSLENKFGFLIPEGNLYRHNEKPDEKRSVLHAYGAHRKITEERKNPQNNVASKQINVQDPQRHRINKRKSKSQGSFLKAV